MADHPFAAKYRAAVEGFNAGDLGAFDDMIADDVEWWEIGAAEPIRGRESLRAAMTAEMGDYTITADIHDVVANDTHLVALLEARATRGDDVLVYRTAEIHHVDDRGRITARWAFSDDTAAIVEFFG
jgi:ketosteroid isomerase-like protein